MKSITRIIICITCICIATTATAQELPRKVQNIAIEDHNNNKTYIPEWGKKSLLIFYVDPEVPNQNSEVVDYIESTECIVSPNIRGLGIVNLKDTVYPNWLVRKIANARTAKNGATILYDTNHHISKAWKLGDCDNKFVTILVNKSGELIYYYKGKMSKSEQQRFLSVAQTLM